MTTGADAALLTFLDAQRACVLAVVDGLSDEQLTRALFPSGWTVIGLVEHLGDAERHWFQQVALGTAESLPWTQDDLETEGNPLTTPHSPEQVLAFYREQVDRSRTVVADHPLATPPRGRHDWPPPAANEVVDLRFIVLHMMEETARHLGHLDIARELLDGRTGLGPR